MKRIINVMAACILALGGAGCCIGSRSWVADKTITGHALPASGTYVHYVNADGSKHIYKYCSNRTGPWEGSDIYPATRNVLNALSGWRYSSAASGDYMLNVVTIPAYPIVLIELPIQLVLDTILLPWDLYAAPTCPDGFHEM